MSRNRKNLSKFTNRPSTTKGLILFFLTAGFFFYRVFLSPLLKTLLGTERICRFTPSCSAYFIQSISEKGIFTGSAQWLRRFLRCQPFTNLSASRH